MHRSTGNVGIGIPLRELINEVSVQTCIATGPLILDGTRVLEERASAWAVHQHRHIPEPTLRLLERVEGELCAPFTNIDRVALDIDPADVRAVVPGSAEREQAGKLVQYGYCLLYTSPSPRDS